MSDIDPVIHPPLIAPEAMDRLEWSAIELFLAEAELYLERFPGAIPLGPAHVRLALAWLRGRLHAMPGNPNDRSKSDG